MIGGETFLHIGGPKAHVRLTATDTFFQQPATVANQNFVKELSSVYNVVGSVKAFLATLPPPRAGRGVNGERSEFIEDP